MRFSLVVSAVILMVVSVPVMADEVEEETYPNSILAHYD